MTRAQRLMPLGFGLAGPLYWRHVIKMQLERVDERQRNVCVVLSRPRSTAEEAMALQPEYAEAMSPLSADAHFLLVAINAVRRIAVRYRKITGDARVPGFVDAFEAVAKPGKLIRDVLEHVEDYAVGEGREQQWGEGGIAPANLPQVELRSHDPEDELDFVYASDRLAIKAAAAAAVQLAEDLDIIWREKTAPGA